MLFSAPLVLFVAWVIAHSTYYTLKQGFLLRYFDLPEPVANFLFPSFTPKPGKGTCGLERDSALEWTDHHCYDPTEDMPWVSYSSGPGVTVYGFPSTGGIYVLSPCFGIELDFLGLDRFNDTPRPSKAFPDWLAKEDANCDRSRSALRLGNSIMSGTSLVEILDMQNGANLSLTSAPSRCYLVANARRTNGKGTPVHVGIQQ